MSVGAGISPARQRLARLFLGVLGLASVVNLGANLVIDLTVPPNGSPSAALQWAIYVSKPLLVPMLAAILFVNTRGLNSSVRLWSMYVALVFCLAGDVALMVGKFVPGLAAFGLSHPFFIAAYLKGMSVRDITHKKALFFALPFLVYGYTIYTILHYGIMHGAEPSMTMSLAVLGYMLLLLSHGAGAMVRAVVRNDRASHCIVLGAVIFVQSDSIIAVGKFVAPLLVEGFAVMATYILALYLIVRGCVLDTSPDPEEAEAPAAQARLAA